MSPSLLCLRHVSKSYDTPTGQFLALTDIDLDLRAGDFLAIVGKSGSGKSTLVNVMTGIDTPTRGSVAAVGKNIEKFGEDRLATWRGRNVGVVFQFFQLLPTLTVVENIMLPMDFCHFLPTSKRRGRAMELLEKLSIGRYADNLPADLSGGQQQRAAIARALANDPPIIVADEPTGNLDSRTSDEVIELFAGLAVEGKAVAMVTHERDLSRHFTRVVELSDGRILSQSEVSVRS
ncbi:MAG: ABC transporter ATP-binding protein [Desulfovibrionales bacterium GWA2_65_9]|nr:MAG: ABC transporter ATP-binding protein [Desulfovibrionales bacterium GWA2_65_9]